MSKKELIEKFEEKIKELRQKYKEILFNAVSVSDFHPLKEIEIKIKELAVKKEILEFLEEPIKEDEIKEIIEFIENF